MRIQVQLFAVARDRLGRSMVEVEVSEGSSVRELRRCLAATFTDLADILPSALLAVDADYAADDKHLASGCEVALIPPVSGG